MPSPDQSGKPPGRTRESCSPANKQAAPVPPSQGATSGEDVRTFHALLAQLGELREQLAQWQAFEERYRRLVTGRLMPLQEAMHEARRAIILQYADILEATHRDACSKSARKRIIRLLIELCQDYLAHKPADADVLAVHDAYAPLRHAVAMAQNTRVSCADPAPTQDAGACSEADAAALADWQDDLADRAAQQREQDAAARRASRRERKARARETGAVATAAPAAQEAQQSVRTLYRRLASALHPDRAADAADSDRRHGLMQRVNIAYAGTDLLSLLALQRETGQIDNDDAARVSQQRLVHYNAVLRGQVAQLQQQIERVTARYRAVLPRPACQLTPQSVEKDLRSHIGALRQQLEAMRAHTRLLRSGKVLLPE
jgi:hypothetical protein